MRESILIYLLTYEFRIECALKLATALLCELHYGCLLWIVVENQTIIHTDKEKEEHNILSVNEFEDIIIEENDKDSHYCKKSNME